MAFYFKCTQCGNFIEARPEQAGRSVPCPSCKALVPVPSQTAAGSQSSPQLPGEHRTAVKTLVMLALGLLSTLYLINPGAGFIEIIPDNIPIIGNLDEAGATILLLRCLAYFGIDLVGFMKPKDRR